jgi:hypothetical protein
MEEYLTGPPTQTDMDIIFSLVTGVSSAIAQTQYRMSTTYLITGANRGTGQDFREEMLKLLEANPKIKDNMVPSDEAVAGVLKCMDTATAETSGGFREWTGETVPW